MSDPTPAALTALDLNELERLATQARDSMAYAACRWLDGLPAGTVDHEANSIASKAQGAFMAAWSPEVILTLLAAARRGEEDTAAARFLRAAYRAAYRAASESGTGSRGEEDGACYVLPNGECISPLPCIHGPGVPLEEFVALLTRRRTDDTATEVTDDDVEAVSEAVGWSPGAWDMVNPKEIIAAARGGAEDTARSHLATATTALENWGRHHSWCERRLVKPDASGNRPPCDCGYEQALAEARAALVDDLPDEPND